MPDAMLRTVFLALTCVVTSLKQRLQLEFACSQIKTRLYDNAAPETCIKDHSTHTTCEAC